MIVILTCVSAQAHAATIVVNSRAARSLSSAQRTALRAAAHAALRPALRRIVADEHAALRTICHPPGGRQQLYLLSATSSDQAGLRAAVAPLMRRLRRDPATGALLSAIAAARRGVTAEPAPRCAAAPRRGIAGRAATGALRLSGVLTETGHSRREGAVSSRVLGAGRLALTHHIAVRPGQLTRRPLKFEARFPGGTLGGCVNMTIAPGPRGTLRWSGPGTIKRTSSALRRFAGLSVRFHGVTRSGDLKRVRGGFATDVPVGIPCAEGSGI